MTLPLLSTDPVAGMHYVKLSDKPIRRTVALTDLIMVDVDTEGQTVGVEFPMGRQ